MAKNPVTPEAHKPEERRRFIYVRDHKRSMRQVVADAHRAAQEDHEKETQETPVEPKEVETPEQSKPVETNEPTQERKEEQKTEPVDPVKIAEEAATKAAQKASEDLRAEFQKIQDSEKSKLEKQKEQEELLSVWDKEGRLPKDYKEIFNESQRIAEIKARRAYEEQRAKDKEEAEAAQKTQEAAQQKAQQDEAKYAQQLEERVQRDIVELKEAQLLDDTTEKEFLQFGIKLNTTRVKEGKPPISDVTKLFFLHYQPQKGKTAAPTTQPAGADAPVVGAKVSHTTELPTDRYVYARDHKKSFRQIMQEGLNRVRGK